jgi:hypothetical protein
LKTEPLRFGFDLDNTLIDYSNSVKKYCFINSLVECKNIDKLRELLRTNDNSGNQWQLAQGWLYTEGLFYAKPAKGAIELCEYLINNNFEIQIVSHKTTHTPVFCGQKPLRSVATKWLTGGDLAPYFLDYRRIHYEPTIALKVAKIKALKLSYFVDDLLKVFEQPGYPKEVNSFLLSVASSQLPWVRNVDSLITIKEIMRHEE